MSKVIAIANQKGGVGKTTTSINLGCGLVRQRKRVCLIDFDFQGNTTQGLGYEPDVLDITIYTIMKRMIVKDYNFETDFGILHHAEGIDLIPANMELSILETELLSVFFGREKVLKNYVGRLKDFYDYIIIDCPPSLNLITMNALVAADEVIIPLQPQFYSVRGLEQLLKIISSIRSNDLNSDLTIAGILYTCVNKQTKSFKDIKAILEEAFGSSLKIFSNFIPRNIKAEEAPSYGKSIYTYDPKGKAALAYDAFTKEYLLQERKGYSWE